MDGDSRPPSWKRAYPDSLKQIENNLLLQRRRPSGADTPKPTNAEQIAEVPNQVGFALSGGGIRSATFCLGIFQALAKQKLLSKIDYLSTVSGGGYFGSFYGRLFTRAPQVTSVADVEAVLATCAASEERDSPPELNRFADGKVFRWLRENGRYLAPRGAGGILLDGAVMMRNWAALQAVLGTFMLMVFLGVQLVRGIAEVTWRDAWWWKDYQNILVRQPWGTHVWWTPYAILPILAFLILAVPPAWNYWLVGKPDLRDVPGGWWIPPIVGLFVTALLAGWYAWKGEITAIRHFCEGVLALSVLTLFWRVFSDVGMNGGIPNSEGIRNRLSVQLKYGLVVTGCLLIFVLIDSLAQTTYAAHLVDKIVLAKWATWFFSMLTVAVGFGRSIFVALGSRADGKRISVPLSVAAGFAALVVVVGLLLTFDICSYAIAWRSALPVEAPPPWLQAKLEPGDLFNVVRQPSGDYLIKRAPASTGKAETVFNFVKQGTEKNQAVETWTVESPAAPDNNPPSPLTLPKGSRNSYSELSLLAAALAISFVFSFLFGWSWPFLNRSTLHPLYTSRLIRAYLGASNPGRMGLTSADVTDVVPGDDLKQEQYWPLHAPAPSVPAVPGALQSFISGAWAKNTSAKRAVDFVSKMIGWLVAPELAIYEKGGPLHLVNVTINETVDGRSAIEQVDRKGVGMAIGPAGISAGVCHHVVFDRNDVQRPTKIYPPVTDQNAFRMFGDVDNFQGERLSLGDWMGVSGAAFSTGLGSRTSLGASFLAGWANVRLGYWWNSGINPTDRKQVMVRSSRYARVSALAGKWVTRLFAMQDFLLSEFIARFRGPASQWWYLTDGGHFENMGGYELIRRRLPLMVIVDAEADPDYTFDGMANLVRKARIDFGAEIEFLREESLDTFVLPSLRGYFGTLEELRRGRWVEEPIEVPGAPPRDPKTPRGKRHSINPADEAALSRAYASLAVVSYRDDPARKSLLLYVKPALIGAEPMDVRRYHTEHSSFPQETTAEQFFNEAQWESYRKLGEHIASLLFGYPLDGEVAPQEKFAPRLGLYGSIPWNVLRSFAQP